MNKKFSFKLLLSLVLIFSLPLVAVAEQAVGIRGLIVLGIEENLGLKIEKLNLPISSSDEIIEAAAFDTEVFALTSYVKAETPIASELSLLDQADSEQLSGQVGLQRRFLTGLAGTISLNTERLSEAPTTDSFDPSYRTGLLLDLTQPLLRDAGRQVNAAGVSLARNRSRQARLNYLLQAQTLALGIADLAYQLEAAEHIVLLRQEAVDLAEKTYQANQKKFAVGVVPISEVQQAETALADRQLRLSLARQNRELLLEELNRQVNQRLPGISAALAVDAGRELAPLVLPDFAVLFAEAQKKRLDLQISEVDQNSAEVQKEFYRNQLLPNLDLQFQAGLNGLSGKMRNAVAASRYQGGWFDSTGSMLEGDGYQWGVGLQFRMPLGNREAQARLQQAELQEQRTRFRARDIVEQLRSDLLQQLTSLKRSDEQLTIAKKFESLAQLSLQQEQMRLDEGLSDTFRILSFQDKMIDARIGRIEAAAQVRRNWAQLDFTRGSILERFDIAVKIDPEGKTDEHI